MPGDWNAIFGGMGNNSQFSPRLADADEAVFWRADQAADYGVLNDMALGQLNPHRIEQHWDDMMRVAGSLKLGTVQASELVRTLLRSERLYWNTSRVQRIVEDLRKQGEQVDDEVLSHISLLP